MDEAVWDYARDNGLVIVSKDADFRQLSFLFGNPPKVIWIQRGNCSTAAVVSLFRQRLSDLLKFGQEEDGAFLALR